MKKFLAVYLGSQTSDSFKKWQSMDEAARKAREDAGMKAWQEWMIRHQGAVKDAGGPLGKTKRTSSAGIADVRNNLSGYTVIEAESHEAAAKAFEQHPHFALFPGESIEIMEVLPIPGQHP
ncbi:MAG TPA: hypothetical protein VGO41_04905 [Steroidobacteraceae bacterium]|jgi:hypothetical protein|nr:hypothetical protein [Steroidobacteraceae bacterium]